MTAYKFTIGERVKRFEEVGRITEISKDSYGNNCYYVSFYGRTPGFYTETELKKYRGK